MKLLIFVTFAVAIVQGASVRQADDEDDCKKACKSRPLEISFVVDASASIWQVNFTLGLNFIETFVDQFVISQEAVRASMVTYGEIVYTQDAFGFDAYSDKESLKLAISQMPYRAGSRTNTSGGIWHMLRQQKPQARDGVRHVVVVLTDGNSQEDELTKQAAKDAREAGLEVFAIGVGLNVSEQELHNIASDDMHVFVVTHYNMLGNIIDRLAYKACDKVPNPVCKMEPVDLSFVIDSSTSIGKGNFTIGMQFVNDFVDFFDVRPNVVRVSAVTFGHRVYREDAFDFDSYTDKKDVMDTLKGLQWRHGRKTETGLGIQYMRDVQMAKSRPNAAHVCIVITDGESQRTKFTKEQARLAQEQGIIMYAVGVGEYGKQLNEAELIDIAGDPRRVMTEKSYAQLNLIKEKLAQITCDYVIQALKERSRQFRE